MRLLLVLSSVLLSDNELKHRVIFFFYAFFEEKVGMFDENLSQSSV